MSARKSYSVSPEQFVKIWQMSGSATELAEKLKMPKPIVLARASGYRSAAVNLKKMPRKSNRNLDVAGLNSFIEEIDGRAAAEKNALNSQ
jgi:hypothetical protein